MSHDISQVKEGLTRKRRIGLMCSFPSFFAFFVFLELPISYCVPCSKDRRGMPSWRFLCLGCGCCLRCITLLLPFFSLSFCFLRVMNYDDDAVPLDHYVDCLEHGSVVGN